MENENLEKLKQILNEDPTLPDVSLTTNETKIPKEPPTGWVQIPVLRGIYEIIPVLDLCDKFGGKVIGGYARYCCSSNENPVNAGDVDIFPVGKDTEESKKIYESWVNQLSTVYKISKIHENNVSITWNNKKDNIVPFNRCPTIQLIKPVDEGAIHTQGSLETVLGNFDFSVVRVAINQDRETATAWASFNEDEKHKQLRLLNIHCPISSLLRVIKYAHKGYYIKPFESLKLFVDWMNRSQEYRDKIIKSFEESRIRELNQKEIDELEALMRID